MDADGAETAECVHCGGIEGGPFPATFGLAGGWQLADYAEWDVVMRVGGFGKVSVGCGIRCADT